MEMNADPEVMRYFLKPLARSASESILRRFRDQIEQRGWGLWAVEVEGRFAGFTGLSRPAFVSHFTPCVEIGWRFRREFWGRGIAYLAARVAEDFAFQTLGVPELVSFTTETNAPSRRLMDRLGFKRDPAEDFDHPRLPHGHRFRRHVLYRKQSNPAQVVRRFDPSHL